MAKRIYLLRHASYASGNSDPGLSSYGEKQALELANKIISDINNPDEKVEIWTSSANRANETAEIIQKTMQVDSLQVKEKLWSDCDHHEDFGWLKGMLDEFEGENLIIVSHLEYVRLFPKEIGFGINHAEYAEGVKIADGQCVNF